ncbi:MAG: hypothetical protein IH895_09565 [Planctomycetes bacterium]|nr:hypothetical protein [Planctomycetota bacterium]
MSDTKKSLNFIEEIIEEDNRTGKWDGRVHTRFPPEPNGYLHIGHAKSICLNFGLAEKYGGRCNLRFDDTNPTKEEQEYIDSIIEDVRWLGFDFGDEPLFASDYFQQMYDWAVQLIKDGKAYVDDLSAEGMASALSEDELYSLFGLKPPPKPSAPQHDERPADEPAIELFGPFGVPVDEPDIARAPDEAVVSSETPFHNIVALQKLVLKQESLSLFQQACQNGKKLPIP